ncbi:hypothetical protein AB0L65_44975 [Nonomuraea sp. NPDC052116]|uniref:hypothetical protein n=1 Tax=Nonomuraea sp. NPDC052116 TaxID=3155665 RepID=UPI003437FB75
MTDHQAFSEDELDQLLQAPRQVTWAATQAEADGIIGMAKELYAGGKVFVAAEQHGNELIRKLATRTPVGETDGSTPEEAIAEALVKVPAAIALLRSKGTEEDVHAYGQWLIEIAVAISDGAKGISGAEQGFIDQLTAAIKG